MSDPSFAGVATLGRIYDIHKSYMAATEIKITITLDIIELEGPHQYKFNKHLIVLKMSGFHKVCMSWLLNPDQQPQIVVPLSCLSMPLVVSSKLMLLF